MISSRLNDPGTTNNREGRDPLKLYEEIIAPYSEMDDYIYNILKSVLINYIGDPLYMNSERYLRLWIMYILYHGTDELILPTLYNLRDSNIGDKLATLYEAIAFFQYEESNKYYIIKILLIIHTVNFLTLFVYK